jgi:4-aminobutyrate aminotransferase-like enzyme/Ser/Thr protein kinase RdoA (MazF antagonist)
MVRVKYESPGFSEDDARRLAAEWYGLWGEVHPLPSERDQNFYFATTSGEQFVLKIANATEQQTVLDLQNEAMEHLAANAPSISLPRLCHTTGGEVMPQIAGANGAKHFLRLLTYIPGKMLAHVRPHTAGLLRSLGHVLGTIDRALERFEHPAAERELKWDLAHAGWIREYLPHISDSARRALVERFLEQFETQVAPRLGSLRTSVIYNDANDYNVVVGSGGPWARRVAGVIDFGDMVRSATIGELAVGAAYACLDKPDPLAAASHIVAGYHHAHPLTEPELEVLFPLIAMRLAVSVTNSAYQRVAEPGNRYLTISEAPAWELLEKLSKIHPRYALYTFRHACHLPPCPTTAAVVRWLHDNAANFAPVVEPDPKTARHLVFDLSVDSRELGGLDEWADPAFATEKLFDRMKAAGAQLGIGRYDEVRALYSSPVFRVEGNCGPEWRTVHTGLDLFLEPGSPVFAPLAGVVHSFRNNGNPLDYGPTIVLRHEVAGGTLSFYTLYGHLSEDSLAGLETGMAVQRGSRIARIGNYPVNGGWPPHLHFQIITDLLDREGDFPGVALPGQRAIWLNLSPDPNLMVNLPAPTAPPEPEMSAGEIQALRSRYIGRALSVSYRQPLEIVRGSRQFLYDENGRPYLDCVNNVAHVGHCHPRVVRAGQEQMAVLNTNTRYLHAEMVRYARRLAGTLPEPLQVCFFVCSGSEANELALRLARTHTGSKQTIVLDAGYHGNTTSLIEISPYKFDGPGGQGAPAHVHKVPLPDDYRGPHKRDDREAGAKYAGHVAEAIEKIRNSGGKMGAFIAESLPGCGGQIVPPPGFLAEAYRHVREAGGVCIADEVQVGFGRVGTHFWGFETQGVVPDIVTMGKPIGNGHPLGAVVTTAAVAASFLNGMEYFNTFGGNPVSCAIGLAVLEAIEEEGLQGHAREVGGRLKAGLESLKERHSLIGDVRGLGLFLGIELVRDRATLAPAAEEASYVVNRARECGILLSTDGPLHNVIKIKPPMVFSTADADRVVATLERILGEDFCAGAR